MRAAITYIYAMMNSTDEYIALKKELQWFLDAPMAPAPASMLAARFAEILEAVEKYEQAMQDAQHVCDAMC